MSHSKFSGNNSNYRNHEQKYIGKVWRWQSRMGCGGAGGVLGWERERVMIARVLRSISLKGDTCPNTGPILDFVFPCRFYCSDQTSLYTHISLAADYKLQLDTCELLPPHSNQLYSFKTSVNLGKRKSAVNNEFGTTMMASDYYKQSIHLVRNE